MRKNDPDTTPYNQLGRTLLDLMPQYPAEIPKWSRREKPADQRWLYRVECKRGGTDSHLEVFSNTEIAFYGDHAKTRKALLDLKGVRAHQTGDEEFSVVFPDSALAAVCKVVKPIKRKG